MAFIFLPTAVNDAGTVTGSSEDSSGNYPVENLLDPRLAVKWTTGAGTTDEFAVFDLGAASSISAIALLDHDLTSGDSAIAIEANSADNWNSPAFSQSLTYAADNIFATFSSQSYRYWRLKFTKASSSVSRSIGRVVLGVATSIQSAQPGFELEENDSSQFARTRGGVCYADTGVQWRDANFDFTALDSTDQGLFRSLWQSNGLHTPFPLRFTVGGVNDAQFIFYGSFAKPPRFKNVGPAIRWDVSMKLQEWK